MTERPPIDDPEKQRCKHCGRAFSNAGIVNHERNCDPWQDLDRFHPNADLPAGWDDDQADPGDESTSPPQPEGDGEQSPTSPNETNQSTDTGARTDGGPQPVPEPDVEPDDQDVDDDPDVEDLPDRYVPVDEFLAEMARKGVSTEDVEQTRQALKGYDVVDTEKTNETSIHAVTIGEVAR